MKIRYSNPHQLPLEKTGDAVFHADPLELVKVSQFLSLNAPETPTTHHFLNAETIALLPEHTIIVNTARGGLIKDDDLSGRVAAAVLTFTKENQSSIKEAGDQSDRRSDRKGAAYDNGSKV